MVLTIVLKFIINWTYYKLYRKKIAAFLLLPFIPDTVNSL